MEQEHVGFVRFHFRRTAVVAALAVAACLVAAPVALAGGATVSSLKGKVKQLQQQLAALQQQVQNIQLQPGPQGSQGSQGAQGAPGSPGAPATIGPDSVALGSQTTGNYVQSVETFNGLAGGTVGAEGPLLQLGLDYSADLGSNVTSAEETVFGDNGVLFEGASPNSSETFITPTNPTGDRTITVPDASGTLLLDGNVNAASVSGSSSSTSVALPVLIRVATTNGSDIVLGLARAMEVVDAWSVNTSADGGQWVLRNAAGNAITNTVTSPASDQALTRATSINDANSSLAPSGLFVESLGTTLDATIYVVAFPE